MQVPYYIPLNGQPQENDVSTRNSENIAFINPTMGSSSSSQVRKKKKGE
jgi:hypothetical protein